MRNNRPFQTALTILFLTGVPCLWADSSQTVGPTQAILEYTDAAGSLAYTWTAPPLSSTNSLGTLHISALESGHPDAEMDLPVSVQPSGGALRLTKIGQTDSFSTAGVLINPTYRLQFTTDNTPVLVTVTPILSGRSVGIDIKSDKGLIAAVICGVWPASAEPQNVAIPYYSGFVAYLRSPDVFANLYFDW